MKWMTMAASLADRSRCKYRHGAVIVKNGRVLSTGWNRQKHSPCDANWRTSSIHAEEAAIRSLRPGSASGATLIVVRVNPRGQYASSAPCLRCDGAISRAGIRRVIHS